MIKFRSKYQLVTLSEIDQFEQDHNLKLPSDYKAHMLEYNGGITESVGVYYGEYDDGINLNYFHPIKYGVTTLEKIAEITNDFLPKNHLSIGTTQTGSLSMSLDKNDYGSIFVYYSDEAPKKIANSFTEFLDGLVDYGDDWNDY